MSAPGTIVERGIIDLPRAEYDALPDRTNFSILKKLNDNPQQYLYALLKLDDDDTDAKARGRAVHMRVLEPELFRSTYVVYEARRAGDAWEKFEKKAQLDGHEVLTAKMHNQVIQLADAIRANVMAAPFLTNGKREQTVLWTHERSSFGGSFDAYSVKMKARPDFIQADRIVDVKTCRSVEPRKFGYQANDLLMHMQGAMYVDGVAAATGTPKKKYTIVAAEEKPPFVTQVYHLTEQQLEAGRQKYLQLLDRLHMCKRDSVWPGYSDAPLDLALPDWALADTEADALEGLIFPDEQEAA